MSRQLTLTTSAEREAQKIARRERLNEQHIQYKQSKQIRTISLAILIFIVGVTIYLWGAALFKNGSNSNSGSVNSGASTMRQSGIDSAESNFMHKYFNIQW